MPDPDPYSGPGLRRVNLGGRDVLTNASDQTLDEMESRVTGGISRVVPYSLERLKAMTDTERDEAFLRILIAIGKQPIYAGDSARVIDTPEYHPPPSYMGLVGIVSGFSLSKKDLNKECTPLRLPYAIAFPDGKDITIPFCGLERVSQHPSNRILEAILQETNDEFAQIYLSRSFNQGLPVR